MQSDSLSAVFFALADPTRRAILARLAAGALNVTELCKPFKMSQPAVSRHLKVLESAGLISRGRAAQSRPCKLEAAPLKEAAGWVAHYSCHWEGSFDRLGDYLVALQQEEAQHEAGNRNS